MPPKPHMVPPPFDPARPELVRPVRIDEAGSTGPTTGQARGPAWRRTSHGFYVPRTVDGSAVEQRIVEAGHFLSGVESVTGWAALRWMGAEWFDGWEPGGATCPVDLAVVHGAHRSQPGIAVTSEFMPPRDRTVVDGLQVTVPVCALSFVMRYAPDVRAAARAFAMAAAADLVSTTEMRAYHELLYHFIGIPQGREGLDLGEENAWSPREMDLALVWQLDARLPRPLLNRPVFDLDGRHVGTPDLLDPVAGVAGQYDGRLHLAGHRRARDLGREDDYRRVGLEYFTVVAEDLAHTARTVTRMHEVRQRALGFPADRRRWTITPPRWWVPTHTVELRRALTPAQRERYLGYRRTG
ncbi:hypothetical protein [Nocardioides pyridinolyticus]